MVVSGLEVMVSLVIACLHFLYLPDFGAFQCQWDQGLGTPANHALRNHSASLGLHLQQSQEDPGETALSR